MMKNFSKENFTFIQSVEGTSYLATFVKEVNQNVYLVVFDKDLNVIKSDNKIYAYLNTQTITLENGETPWYEDNYNLCENRNCNLRVKIEDNLIYNLYTNYSATSKSGSLEEREYTIENGKLIYKVNKDYKILSLANKNN